MVSGRQAGIILQATPKVKGAAPKTDPWLAQPVLVCVGVWNAQMWFHSIFKPKLNLQEEKTYDWRCQNGGGRQLPSFHIFNCGPYFASSFRRSQSLPWSHCPKKNEMEKKRKIRHNLFTNNVDANGEIWRNRMFVYFVYISCDRRKKRKERNERGNATIFQARGDLWKKTLPGWVCCVCFSSRTHWNLSHIGASLSRLHWTKHRLAAEELPNPAPALQVLFLRSINKDRSLSWDSSYSLCWKAQFDNDCWPTTKKHVSSIPAEKLVPMTHTIFPIPCHHWIPKKYMTVTLESYFVDIEVVYFTAILFWLSLHAAHTYKLYMYILYSYIITFINII